MKTLQIIHPEMGGVRTQIDDNNQPWFCAKDVCDILNLSETSNTISRLDDDEKLTRIVFASGQNREMWFVTESGLYNLIFQSRKPEAKKFRKWVTAEVLPCIREHGQYPAPMPKPVNHSNIDLLKDYEIALLKEIIKVESTRTRTTLAAMVSMFSNTLERIIAHGNSRIN